MYLESPFLISSVRAESTVSADSDAVSRAACAAGRAYASRDLATLDWLTARRHPARAGFVHLPLSPAMVAASGLEQPSMDVGLMVRAVEIALGVIARTTQSA